MNKHNLFLRQYTERLRKTLSAWLLFAVLFAQAQGELPVKEVRGSSFTATELLWLLVQLNQDHYSGISFVECKFYQGDDEDRALQVFAPYSEASRLREKINAVAKPKLNFSIRFSKCEFNPNENRQVQLTGLFLQELTFENCTGYGVELSENVLYLRPSFVDCNFKYLKLYNNRFFEELTFNDCKIEQVDMANCAFIRNPLSGSLGMFFTNRNQFDFFSISQCEFVDASKNSARYKNFDHMVHDDGIISFDDFMSNQLTITDCYFDCTLAFGSFIVQNKFEFTGNQLLRELVFDAIPSLPTEASQIPYAQFQTMHLTTKAKGENDKLQNKIGIAIPLGQGENQYIRYNQEADFKSDINKPWANRDPEKRIIPVYSRLLAIYDANNDLESYNHCFNDQKEIEKTSSKVRYDTYGNFQDLFKWGMEQFLQDYSAYGTDPVLSLINGFWTIVLFACLYALFPSEEDNLTLHRIRGAFQKYIAHFGKGEKTFFTPDEIYQAELARVSALRNDINIYQNQMPPVIRAFAEPIYWATRFVAFLKHQARLLFYFNVYDDWQTLSKKRKISTTAILTGSLLLFALWGLFMRSLNAMALSMNAFVTLGYGEIEAKGVARYFCVFEGIIGWFLLSIFSVSLISQILQ